MGKRNVLTVILEINTEICGIIIKDKNKNIIQFNDLSHDEQVKVLGCLSSTHNTWVRFLKEK